MNDDRRNDGRHDGDGGSAMNRALRDYRAASDALDERPSAHARAAILAAAAREVGAKPHDAAASGAPPRRRPMTLRWPMAAAATVLLSSLAVMMAGRVEQSQSVGDIAPAPAERAAEPSSVVVPIAPDPRAAPEAAAPAIAPAPTPAIAPAPAPPIAAPRSSAAPVQERRARAPAQASARDNASAEASRERSVTQGAAAPPPPASMQPAPATSAATTPPAAPPAPAIAPPAPAIAPPAAPPVAADAAIASKPEAAPLAKEAAQREVRRDAAAGAARRAEALPADRAATDAEGSALSAADWLARIVRLREAGRHADADAQLLRFRERYPQVNVPATALPPAGTR